MLDWLLGPETSNFTPPIDQCNEIERIRRMKALALVGDVDPAFNLQQVIDLVAKADAMGFDVVRRPQTVLARDSVDPPLKGG